MKPRDIILTGVPRGGTTLACQLLQACRHCVALFEPMDVAAVPPGDRGAAVAEVLRFFAATRAQIAREGVAPSMQVDGAVPDNSFANTLGADGRRQLVASPGLIQVDTQGRPDFSLVIKHNAMFTALLPELGQHFQVLAIVRHPLSVLASWNSVELPVSEGRLPAGERFDEELAARLHAQADRLSRQFLVLDWFFSRFDRLLPALDVLRYEDVVASQGAQLRARAGLDGEPVAGLAERNTNSLYSRSAIPALADALGRRDGSWQRWYPAETIAPLAERMLAANPGT